MTFLLFASFFRSDTIEAVLCGSLFPSEFAMNDIVKHWIDIFSGLDNVEVRALERILEQKQRWAWLTYVMTYIFYGVSSLRFSWFLFNGRLQEELQKYLALRQNSQVCLWWLRKLKSWTFKRILIWRRYWSLSNAG